MTMTNLICHLLEFDKNLQNKRRKQEQDRYRQTIKPPDKQQFPASICLAFHVRCEILVRVMNQDGFFQDTFFIDFVQSLFLYTFV